MSKTIKVRIAVAVSRDGSEWCAMGWKRSDEKEQTEDDYLREAALDAMDTTDVFYVYVEAEIPIPDDVTVQGEVRP